MDLVGQSIYEFVHPCDHEDITDIFHNTGRDKKKSDDRHHTFFVRMKCTLTNKGKNVNLKSATYKVRVTVFCRHSKDIYPESK